MSQSDLIWLDLYSRPQDIYLREHQRAYAVLQLLPHPEIQKPQLITLLGDKAKTLFLRKCFSLECGENHKKILLRVIPAHFNSDTPILVADSELHNSLALTTLATGGNTGGVEKHSLKWLRNAPQAIDSSSLAHLVYTQLLLPFSTIVCIFASDFDGTDKVAKFLASWLRLRNRQPVFPSSTFARVLIFVKSERHGSFDERLETSSFLKQLRSAIREEKGISGLFRDENLTNVEFEKLLRENAFELRLLALPVLEDETHLKTFRTRLLHESEEIYNFRKATRIAFSARHFQAFFQFACRHFADSITSPFDFVLASRIPNPIPIDFSSHIAHVMMCIGNGHRDIIATIIASALYLDNFPPGAHVFEPCLVFDTLYSRMLEDALSSLPNWNQVMQNIKINFCGDKDYNNTAWFHKQLLHYFTDVWKTTFSNSTCLSCLARTPSSVLPCKHSFCDTCVVIHGKNDLEEPWNFRFSSCPLCDESMQATILLKPYSAGIRCIVLDGGSYADFEMLDALEKKLCLPISIREHFDIVNASGIGAWVLFERFCKDERCVEDGLNYEKIRREIQGPQSPPVSRFSDGHDVGIALKRLEDAFKVLPRWSGTLHSSLKIVSTLNAIFGERTLFECSQGSTKLCITATRSKDSATCVLSNYNGDGRRSTTYKHVRERKIKNEIQLSQCARMSLSGKSVYGYHAKERDVPNEIIEIALKEQEIIWGREGRDPDILLALGGRVKPCDQLLVPQKVPEWLADFRLYNYGILLDRTVDALLASLFYVELISPPQLDELGLYFCRVQVRCRILPSSSAYRTLVERLRKQRARFYYDYKSIPCVNRQLYNEAVRGIAFSRCIEISLLTLQHNIDVKIDGITGTSRRISNCPYRAQQLIKDQGLDCVFGSKDHKMRYFGSIWESRARFI